MADENELIKLREELKQIQDATRRSRRRGAIGFVILIFALAVCLVYSFVQQVAATKNAEEALSQHYQVEACEVEARKQQVIAQEQQAAARAAVEQARLEAMAAIERCKGKK